MIKVKDFLTSISVIAEARGFDVSELEQVAAEKYPILSFTRAPSEKAKKAFRLYLSSGVHGDEPAGPLAIERLLQDDLLPRDIDICILPMVNPTGFAAKTRENADGHDLNRDFRLPQNNETAAAKKFIVKQAPFHLSLAIHEDWESSGFYLYAISSDGDLSLPRVIIEAVSEIGPIDPSEEIDGSPSQEGLISRPAEFDLDEREDWPEAFLLYSISKHRHFTTETPSSGPIEQRINMQLTAILKAIELVRAEAQFE